MGTEGLDPLMRQVRNVELAHERNRVATDDLRSQVAHMEILLSKNQTELVYAQQQLEFVVMTLERERGIIAGHTEQLRLFAGETSKRSKSASGQGDRKPTLLVIANWLYGPLLHFTKGVYTLFSPIISTAQSLSLLNSEVLQRREGESSARLGETRKGDLLVMLQRGLLDPISVSRRKDEQ